MNTIQWLLSTPGVHEDGFQIPRAGTDQTRVKRVSTTAEWLLEISGLTVGAAEGATCDIVEHGRALALQLRSAAAVYRAIAPCGDAACLDGCPLDDVDGGHAGCRLAGRLAPPPELLASPLLDRDRSVLQYRQAIRAAATAVFHCRRIAHPTGECWFADDGADVCADVLAAAHRMGG